jgi:HAD superfamily hydrolase (TIGR01549 family)
MLDRRIKAVLFDLGETLLAFGKVNMSKLFRQGAKLSYHFLQSCNQPTGSFRRYCRRNLMTIRMHYWLSNITGRDFDSLALLKKINEKKGIRLADEQWRQLAWLWYEPLSRFGMVEADISHTLTALTRMRLKLGILSNTFINSSPLEEHLRQFGILHFFPARLYSYEFHFRKPDVRIFKAAAQRIGEPVENTLFVGDRIDKDIKPALKAGMHAVLKTAYTNVGKKTPAGICKINHLSELPALLEKINNPAFEYSKNIT